MAPRLFPGDPGGAAAAAAAIEVGRQQQPRLCGGTHEGAPAIHDQGGAASGPPSALRSAGVFLRFSARPFRRFVSVRRGCVSVDLSVSLSFGSILPVGLPVRRSLGRYVFSVGRLVHLLVGRYVDLSVGLVIGPFVGPCVRRSVDRPVVLSI